MSQYPSMPPSGPYIPPSQGLPAQQQGSQQPSPYPSTQNYGAPNQVHKSGGTFGQMMNQRLEQAVTTGKPMLNKLGKTISSKLGNKPPPGPPQHLQSYQSYQTHQGQQVQTQGYPQPQTQTFSSHTQQQQWSQPQHPPAYQTPNVYVSPQQSPYQQSNYATPASGHSGQSTYFPQPTNQAPNPQAHSPQQPLMTPGYDTNAYNQSGNTVEQAQTQAHQAQYGQSHVLQGQPQASCQHEQQQQQHHYPGQQAGIVGSSQVVPVMRSPQISAQPLQPQGNYSSTERISSPATQQQHAMPTNFSQSHHSAPSSPAQQGLQQQQRQCNSTSSISPYNGPQMQIPPHSVSPSPVQQMKATPQIPSSTPGQSTKPSTPASQHTVPAPTEFIAELPAELGNLSLTESKPQGPDQSAASSQYQTFHTSESHKGSPTPRFTIPRRSLSASTFPLADPWRLADPVTEVPTREFYILADLLFDVLDRKFEPTNTGLLEAPKIISSWVKLTEDATRECSWYQAWVAC
jgi:hypothetical protein